MENMTLFEVVKMGKSATQVGTRCCGEDSLSVWSGSFWLELWFSLLFGLNCDGGIVLVILNMEF